MQLARVIKKLNRVTNRGQQKLNKVTNRDWQKLNKITNKATRKRLVGLYFYLYKIYISNYSLPLITAYTEYVVYILSIYIYIIIRYL